MYPLPRGPLTCLSCVQSLGRFSRHPLTCLSCRHPNGSPDAKISRGPLTCLSCIQSLGRFLIGPLTCLSCMKDLGHEKHPFLKGAKIALKYSILPKRSVQLSILYTEFGTFFARSVNVSILYAESGILSQNFRFWIHTPFAR